jgi:hypothetical protein
LLGKAECSHSQEKKENYNRTTKTVKNHKYLLNGPWRGIGPHISLDLWERMGKGIVPPVMVVN